MSLWLLTPRESFAAEAIDHVKHEQFSLVRTSETVDDKELEAGSGSVALRLKPGAARVSYAQSCTFRGQQSSASGRANGTGTSDSRWS